MVPQNKHIALSAISIKERLLMENEPLLNRLSENRKSLLHIQGI